MAQTTEQQKFFGRYGLIDQECDYGADTPHERVDVVYSQKEAYGAYFVATDDDPDMNRPKSHESFYGCGEVKIGGECEGRIGSWIRFFTQVEFGEEGCDPTPIYFVGQIKAHFHINETTQFVVSNLISLEADDFSNEFLDNSVICKIIELSGGLN